MERAQPLHLTSLVHYRVAIHRPLYCHRPLLLDFHTGFPGILKTGGTPTHFTFLFSPSPAIPHDRFLAPRVAVSTAASAACALRPAAKQPPSGTPRHIWLP
eukprot:COSAG01_NODE_42443_length_440_cov_0.659824_1_plen_100_part_01